MGLSEWSDWHVVATRGEIAREVEVDACIGIYNAYDILICETLVKNSAFPVGIAGSQ